jgi:hypothetical protein
MEYRRFGRIQILRTLITEYAPAKTDDTAAQVADRERHPVAESIVDPSGLVLHDETRSEEIVLGNTC